MIDHRRDDSGFERHGQREVAGETETEGADTRTATLGVRQPGEAAQPGDDGAGAATGERPELGADARAPNDGLACLGERIGAVDTEQ